MRSTSAERPFSRRFRWVPVLALFVVMSGAASAGTEPDPSTYWRVQDIKTGMKGTGRTVMVGTKLEEFGAEVLGVMRDVSPGRDMILCRLTGCNLEHAGIIQGMSGSPIYVDGKLLGAVAFAWEFGKDPIAGVTPFGQMLQYVRSSDRRIAAEARDQGQGRDKDKVGSANSARLELPWSVDDPSKEAELAALPVTAGAAGMQPIMTPMAASGFSPRALAFLGKRLGPIGMAPMAGGGAGDEVIKLEGDKPLAPGAPLSIAMVMGDFDLSGIGTVTHVEGDRVYGFGHPMMSLGACDFPMMTGYIHTVYPRASVSMKMGSPLKVVGVIDTDVSTGVAGRLGRKPDMLPLSVRVSNGTYSEPRSFKVQIVREPSMLPTLVMAVLSNAIDTEGNLPDELTARISTTLKLKGHEPITLADTYSGPRYSGTMGPSSLFAPIAGIINMLVRNPLAPVRIESIESTVDITPGRSLAEVEEVRLASNRLEPGGTLKATVTIKPYKGDRKTVDIELKLPADLPEGNYEAAVCDMGNSLRRRLRNEPQRVDPRDLDGLLDLVRFQGKTKRDSLYLHVALPERGLSVEGQSLPNLPGSVRAVFASRRRTSEVPVRSDLIQSVSTPWVVEGTQTIKFNVVKDDDLSLKE